MYRCFRSDRNRRDKVNSISWVQYGYFGFTDSSSIPLAFSSPVLAKQRSPPLRIAPADDGPVRRAARTGSQSSSVRPPIPAGSSQRIKDSTRQPLSRMYGDGPLKGEEHGCCHTVNTFTYLPLPPKSSLLPGAGQGCSG